MSEEIVTENTVIVVQFHDGDDWRDTADGDRFQREQSARNFRAWYDQHVGHPSRIVERYTRETVIAD